MERFIKVIMADGSKAVINANNKDYYLQLGADVTDATEEEVREYHSGSMAEQKSCECGKDAKIAKLEEDIKQKDILIAKLREGMKALNEQLESTKEELDAIKDAKSTKTTKNKK